MKQRNEKRKRISSTFSGQLLERFENYKRERGLSTYSECLNEIVELGFQKKEEAMLAVNDAILPSQSTTQISPEMTELLAIKRVLANNSAWVMESRLLNRYLVANMPNQPKETGLEILKRFKERASDFILKKMKAHFPQSERSAAEKEAILMREQIQKIR